MINKSVNNRYRRHQFSEIYDAKDSEGQEMILNVKITIK